MVALPSAWLPGRAQVALGRGEPHGCPPGRSAGQSDSEDFSGSGDFAAASDWSLPRLRTRA
ncbi:hypothetical protein AN220_00905 [Streptomyces nanshensis]|nr:hypothetical protein AN220_00905 [Streptomyces nanshensis]